MPILHKLDHKPDPQEAQDLVKGFVQLVWIDHDKQLLINEDGIPMGLPENIEATELAGMQLFGDIVLLEGENCWRSEEEEEEDLDEDDLETEG